MGKHRKPKNFKLPFTAAAVSVGTGALLLGSAGTANATASMTPDEVADIARQTCPSLSPEQVKTAVQIAGAESGLEPRAHNTNGEDSRGLWQINRAAHGDKYGDLFNPWNNGRAMCAISNQGTNWRPWTVYTSGAYLSEPGPSVSAPKTFVPPQAPAPKPAPKPAPQPSAPKPAPVKPVPNHVTPKAPTTTAPKKVVIPENKFKPGEKVKVQPGDTLWDLFGADWLPVYEKNRDVIGDNPDLIYPDQVIVNIK